ncbi:glycosyltransferase family 25 protein [Rhizobium sp. CFBP 8752]|nr:glycosyltransferase family 25 protein [Rhizobium sp. CFBP 8752]
MPDSQRRERCRQQLVDAKARHIFIDAIDGFALSSSEITAAGYDASDDLQSFKRKLSLGEIGCYLSHKAVWSRIACEGRPAVVLEDDFEIQPDFVAEIDKILKYDVDNVLVKLNAPAAKRCKSLEFFDVSRSSGLKRHAKVGSRTTGYLIGAAAAEKMLTIRKTFSRPIDIDMKFLWEHGVPILEAEPPLVRERFAGATQSSIDLSREAVKPRTLFRRFLKNIRYQADYSRSLLAWRSRWEPIRMVHEVAPLPRNLAAARTHLVIVRAGQRSLHPGWLNLPYAERSFDLVVSYYDKEAFASHVEQEGVRAHLNLGGKWDGLYVALEMLTADLDRYDYVWLPDDDIETNSGSINALFDLMKTHDLSVAQPSLTRNSYYTHFIFLNCPGLQLRRTNYVEIMVPCLSMALLKAVKQHFRGSMSGFGLDYIWCRLPEAGVGRAAILDTVVVRHTRPVGNVLAASMQRSGVSPKDEEARLNSVYGLTERITPLAYTALSVDGTEVRGRARTGFTMAWRYGRTLWTEPGTDRTYDLSRIVQLLRRQLTRKLNLSLIFATGTEKGLATETTAGSGLQPISDHKI